MASTVDGTTEQIHLRMGFYITAVDVSLLVLGWKYAARACAAANFLGVAIACYYYLQGVSYSVC